MEVVSHRHQYLRWFVAYELRKIRMEAIITRSSYIRHIAWTDTSKMDTGHSGSAERHNYLITNLTAMYRLQQLFNVYGMCIKQEIDDIRNSMNYFYTPRTQRYSV